MTIKRTYYIEALTVFCTLCLAGCDFGGNSTAAAPAAAPPPAQTATYLVGGSVSGLLGTVVLQNNLGDDLLVTSTDGSATPFAFATKVVQSGAYGVTIKTQPAGGLCVVGNGHGFAASDIANVSVSCAHAFTVGGVASGLHGTLVLQNNGGDDLPVVGTAADQPAVPAAFTFSSAIADRAGYAVTIKSQPDGQVCKIDSGGADQIGGQNVTNVMISCATGLHIESVPFTVQPGQDITFCYYFTFPNQQSASIKSIRSNLPAVVQSMTVWAFSNGGKASGSFIPETCGVGSVNTAEPLYVTRRASDGANHELTFPADDGDGHPVGFHLRVQKGAAMQIHFVNPGTKQQTAHVDLDVLLYPDGTMTTPVGIWESYQLSIHITPGGPQTPVTARFGGTCPTTQSPDDVPPKFFNMSVTTHQRGVHTAITDGGNIVHEDGGWDTPARKVIDTPPFLSFASQQIGYTCDYLNPDPTSIFTGDEEISGQETCSVVAYYFPLTSDVLDGHLCGDSLLLF